MEREIIYDDEHWELLKEKRALAKDMIEFLVQRGIKPYVFGSVARGDVHKHSDVEIVILNHGFLSYIDILLSQNFSVIEKEIIQATPRAAIKVVFRLENLLEIVVPAVPLTNIEYEFYRYGGIIAPPDVYDYKTRVPGVDKRLCLILPTKDGHIEFSIIGRESEIIKILRISPELLEERKRVLMRRDSLGRTGVYLNIKLGPEESIIKILRHLQDRDPAVRRLLKMRGVYI